jgi:hypothetical protein
MPTLLSTRAFVLALLFTVDATPTLFAQELPPASSAPLHGAATAVSAATPASKSDQVVVPLGTRLPLLLRNGVNTRTAKAGDSVYFETAYPIAVNNKIAIPPRHVRTRPDSRSEAPRPNQGPRRVSYRARANDLSKRLHDSVAGDAKQRGPRWTRRC